MGRKSRRKGARGENEVANILRTRGWDASRNRIGVTVQDIVHDIPGVHLEVKRAEKIQLQAWLRQAEDDAREGDHPAVVFRRSRDPWRVVIRFDHFLDLLDGLRPGATIDSFGSHETVLGRDNEHEEHREEQVRDVSEDGDGVD